MKPESLARVLTDGYAYDTETHLIKPGMKHPPMVCASVAREGKGDLLSPTKALAFFRAIIKSKTIILANAPFDMGVMIAYARKLGIDLIPEIFEAYEREGVFDVLLCQRLSALADGNMGFHPITRDPVRYSLAQTTEILTGRADAKANDKWRLRYQELDGIPLEMWPEQARTYPIDDVLNTYECAAKQVRINKNLHDLQSQMYTDFCLVLGAARGLRVDPPRIDALETKTIADRAVRQKEMVRLGFLREEKKKGETVFIKDGPTVKRRVAQAFGVTGHCSLCNGTAKIPSTTACAECEGTGEACFVTPCASCKATGKVNKTKRHTTCKGKGCDDCDDTGKMIASYKGCTDCSGTGLDLKSAPYPLTKTGGVSAGRDALDESGDDDLLEFARYDETAKVLSTYIPWLRTGIAENGDIQPLTLEPRVMKETGRIGYGGAAHTMPQDMGVRECVIPNTGTVIIAADYVGAELRTHAQNCYDMVGFSCMGDALNSGIDVHSQLGAKTAGIPYSDMVAGRNTIKALGDQRQAAKPINFGAPGLLGAPTLVMQQRKQGPDTTAPNGKVYKGLRFCILAGGETVCGHTKVTQWYGRLISPMCAACVDTAAKIIKDWKETWTENVEYFKLIKDIHKTGVMTQHYTKRVRKGMSLCSTANGFFQGLASDIIKLAIRRVSYEMYCKKASYLYGCFLLLPVHDELLIEAPIGQEHEASERLKQIMIECMVEMCPRMEASAEVDVAAMDRWSKFAKTIYKDGRLVPWSEA